MKNSKDSQYIKIHVDVKKEEEKNHFHKLNTGEDRPSILNMYMSKKEDTSA